MVMYKLYQEFSKKLIQRFFSGKERLQATASDKAKYFSLKNKKKTVKIIRVYGAHCHIVFLLSGCFFSYAQRKLVF